MGYNTEQKKMILLFFKTHPDEQFGADEIYENISFADCGKSTVYRLLQKMSEEGILRRYVKEDSRKALYQYADGHCAQHIHLRCVECGKVIHMDDSLSDALRDEIMRSNAFTLDEGATVIPGKCGECRASEK